MTFEENFGRVNERFFFQEFTYSENKFRPTPAEELELADSIIWLGDLAIVFQLKERTISGASTPAVEESWFKNKVVGRGTKQIRDTLAYLKLNRKIELENHREHRFQIDGSKISTLHKVICYLANPCLPDQCRMRKFHKSKTAGVIHLIPANDYLGIIRTLITPSELSEYLKFRESLIRNWESKVEAVPEQALVGQFIAGDAKSVPCISFVQNLTDLEHRQHEWDMSGVISQFSDRITTDTGATDYYCIVAEIAKLKRNELREFKKRFQLSMEKSEANDFVKPYRFALPRTDCAFVFIPLTKELAQERQTGLKNLTLACKYDLQCTKCVGVSIAPDGHEWYSVEWCYIEYPWEFDAELDQSLRENNPFRNVRTAEIKTYVA